MIKNTFGSQDYGIGILWSRLGATKIAAERERLSKEQNMPYGLSRKFEDDEGEERYSIGLTDNKELVGLPSAAALLSDIESNLLLVEKLSDGRYWVCAIYDNEVVPGGDVVCSKIELRDKVADYYVQMTSTQESELAFCVLDAIKTELMLDFGESVNLDFVGILKEYDASPSSSHKIRPIQSVNKAVITLGGVALAVMAYFAVNMVRGDRSNSGFEEPDWSTEPDIDVATPDVVSPVESIIQEVKPKAPSKSDIMSIALNEEIEWLKERFEHGSPSDKVKAFVEFYTDYPKSIAGWDASSISMADTNQDYVAVQLSKGNLGTTLTLREAIGDVAHKLSFGLDGRSAVAIYKLSDFRRREFSDILSHIGSVGYKREEWMHDLDVFGYQWSMSTFKQSERPKPIEGAEKKDALTRQLKNEIIEVKVAGTDEFMLYNLSRLLEYGKSTIINTIKIQVNTNSAWEFTGEIYEK